jgi:hypothetical protein
LIVLSKTHALQLSDWKEVPERLRMDFDICQTMSSRVRPQSYEQPGRTFPLQFQCDAAIARRRKLDFPIT